MPLKTYLVNKILNRRYRLDGIVPSNHLPRKTNLCQSFSNSLKYSPQDLPPKIDLRNDMTSVEDQSTIGSCAANALAGAYEYLTKKKDGHNVDISRLFVYYNARTQGNRSNTVTDSGCTMTDAIEALEKFGTCLESLWPYDVSKVNQRPTDEAYRAAENHKISEALRINIDLNEMKSCLAQGFPFAFGLRLYTSFDQAAKTGVVPMPSSIDRSRQAHGAHALLAVGYSDQSRSFIVRNSWGDDWGDKGYCYIPYDYLTDANLCFDIWTIRRVPLDDFGQNHWDNNDDIDYKQGSENADSYDDFNHLIQRLDEEDDSVFSGSDIDRFGGDTGHFGGGTGSFGRDTNRFGEDTGYYGRDTGGFGGDTGYYGSDTGGFGGGMRGFSGDTSRFGGATDDFRGGMEGFGGDGWGRNDDFGFQSQNLSQHDSGSHQRGKHGHHRYQDEDDYGNYN